MFPNGSRCFFFLFASLLGIPAALAVDGTMLEVGVAQGQREGFDVRQVALAEVGGHHLQDVGGPQEVALVALGGLEEAEQQFLGRGHAVELAVVLFDGRLFLACEVVAFAVAQFPDGLSVQLLIVDGCRGVDIARH